MKPITFVNRCRDILRPVVRAARRKKAWLDNQYALARLHINHQRHVLLPRRVATRKVPNVVVSLTSFPPRIQHVWITIESLLKQTIAPEELILVLAETQFPGRQLPASLKRQLKRGLSILWTDTDTRSYKKLLPVREAFPRSTIITVDDDVIYRPWMLKGLLDKAAEFPNTVIGYTGWEIVEREGSLAPYLEWPPARPWTDPSRTLLTGVGGILYPPGCHVVSSLCDFEEADRLCPRGDDIWFWAQSRLNGVGAHCMAKCSFQYYPHPDDWPELFHDNRLMGENDRQLAAVLNAYGDNVLLSTMPTPHGQ